MRFLPDHRTQEMLTFLWLCNIDNDEIFSVSCSHVSAKTIPCPVPLLIVRASHCYCWYYRGFSGLSCFHLNFSSMRSVMLVSNQVIPSFVAPLQSTQSLARISSYMGRICTVSGIIDAIMAPPLQSTKG